MDFVNEQDQDNDLIEQTLPLINKNYTERHIIEQNLPMMYEQRKSRKNLGCLHTLTNCLLWCDQCQNYFICPRCHDEQVFDHQLKYKQIQKCKCLRCNTEQNVGEKCINCGLMFASNWCEKCRVLRIVDNQSTPVFHCQKHDECHYNTHPKFSFCCDKCKSCFPNDNLEYHNCNGTTCCICYEQILKEDDVIFCCENHKHVFHSNCFDQLVSNNIKNPRCPLCNTLLYDYSTLKYLQLRNIQQMRYNYGLNLVFNNQQFIGLFYQDKCSYCNKQSINISANICPHCFSYCQSVLQIYDFDQIKKYLNNEIQCDQIQQEYINQQQLLEQFKQQVCTQTDLYKSFRLLMKLDNGDTKYYTDRLIIDLWIKQKLSKLTPKQLKYILTTKEDIFQQRDRIEYISQVEGIPQEQIEQLINNIALNEQYNEINEDYEEQEEKYE